MAVENVLLDGVVRRTLAEHNLPLHWYVPFLVYATRGLKMMHYAVLRKLISVNLPVDPDSGLVTLPDDFVEDVLVGVEVGDKVKPIGQALNMNMRDNNGEKFDQVADFSNSLIETNDLYNWEGLSGAYGLGVNWSDNYIVMRDQGVIRIDNDSSITDIHLVYITSPKKISSVSIVHPYAEDAIQDYITWKFAQHNPRNRFDPNTKKSIFDNSFRLLRASKNKMTITDLKRSFRKYYKQSPKN